MDILEYEALVKKIAGKYSRYGDYDDLYQAGMMGLLKALKEYKPGIAKFSTYAYTWIIGEITTYIRENQTLKKSKDIIRLSRQIEKCRELLFQKLQREPTDLEISLITEIDEEKIREIRILNQNTESLDYITEESSESLYNSIKTYDINIDSEHLDLKNELSKLSEDERNLIYDRYYQGYTQSELSKELGMSQVQISRKEAKILQKLKVKL